MELNVAAQNVELTPALERYVQRKLGRLSRHLPNITSSKVEIAAQKTRSPQQRYVVQLTIDSNGTLLRGEERAGDLFTAIDKVAEIMNRQIEHYKGKHYDRGRGVAPPEIEQATGDSSPETETTPATGGVVKVKRFSIKPMSVDEAVDQMLLLGHDFFLFFNCETEKLNLVYRRKDGDYGLIEPELG